jgi:hypothetical protein
MTNLEQKRRRIDDIRRSIIKMENPIPDDNLIRSYKAFLAHRKFLLSYQFNFKVLEALVDLTLRLWETESRISRISLITIIKGYGYKAPWGKVKPEKNYPKSFNTKVFELFRLCHEDRAKLTKKQSKEAKRLCNYMLIGAELNSESLKWLCRHATVGTHAYNRVIRYPFGSVLITDWIKQVWNKDMIRLRRAEATSWLIDENPEYELDQSVLWADFYFANNLDQEIIDEYESSLAVDQLLGGPQGFPKGGSRMEEGEAWSDFDLPLLTPEFKLTQRNYSISSVYSEKHGQHLPDFDQSEQTFEATIDGHFHATMLWAIAYSRLEAKRKEHLLRKHYTEENYFSFLKVVKRENLVNSLNWLRDQLESTHE